MGQKEGSSKGVAKRGSANHAHPKKGILKKSWRGDGRVRKTGGAEIGMGRHEAFIKKKGA